MDIQSSLNLQKLKKSKVKVVNKMVIKYIVVGTNINQKMYKITN